MLSREPIIQVGVLEHRKEIQGELSGPFALNDSVSIEGPFKVKCDQAGIAFTASKVFKLVKQAEIICKPLGTGSFVLNDVVIGVQFHWEREEDQSFAGSLRIVKDGDGTIAAINEVALEEYLKSVISSEMNAAAPLELLKAHAMTSRSWLVAVLQREQKNIGIPSQRSRTSENELVRWYDREDHKFFDVCADDHCQRYQGVTKIVSPAVEEAIQTTRGMFLVCDDDICDARYSKACGGLTDNFESAWDEKHIPYLTCVSDSTTQHAPLATEGLAQEWILGAPDAYCNTTDGGILRQVLPSFDQETTDFFRWKVEYSAKELAELVKSKSGIDFGTIMNIRALKRGPSGRIVRLLIEGTKKTMTVGKELEIRRWFSKSHLYSSAFVVKTETGRDGIPMRFVFQGAGWGHGVGLCQIGAAVMATKGFKAEEIVKHYFKGAELKKLY
ncbi:MAG: SpoIID/LytB domain-containing protein [Ignavibacteriales bacterium]|nr:SpoIID/LytB domain-containing protein [Ignavibacteriales bacterium]